MRSAIEVISLIEELKKQNEEIIKNKRKFIDKNVPFNMIKENNSIIFALEWILGKHDKYD